MISIHVDLRRNQNIGTKMRFVLVVRASHYTTAVHSTEKAAQRPAAWYELLLNDAWGVPCWMSSRCGPYCFVLAVCCVLSSCGVAKTDHHNSCWKKRRTDFAWHLPGSRWSETDHMVICQFSQLRTPRARAADLGQGPHLHRGVHAGLLRAPQPRKDPRAEEQKMPMCKKCPFDT